MGDKGVSDGVLLKAGVLVGGLGTYISCPARIMVPSLKQFALCSSTKLTLNTTLRLKSESLGLTTYRIHPSGCSHCVAWMPDPVVSFEEINGV